MLFKKKLLVFPTSRSIREYVNKQKELNLLLPTTLTIDEFLKKSTTIKNRKYIDEEQRFLYLNQAIKEIDISKLGISKSFTKFLKQYDYIYRFLLELSSEKIDIDDIELIDTYEYYKEHLEILKNIKQKYLEILEKENCVDRINLNDFYEINEEFVKRYDSVEIYFEGYFTKVEFDIIKKISKNINLNISFYSNIYNQKSLEIFKNIIPNIKIDYKYIVNLCNEEIIKEEKNNKLSQSINLKAFNSRITQIAYIKSIITQSIKNGINPSNIALVLPDESFATQIQLFDNEKYFNYAMGKNIFNSNIYQVSNAIYQYIINDEPKELENIKFLNIEQNLIDINIKKHWNNICNLQLFESIIDFIKNYENDVELLEKFYELIYKFNILLFSNNEKILTKDVYKIFLQKLAKITLDDVNSGKITVLGLLETRTLKFDTVIICDFNESFIPKTSVKDKFLSTKLKQLSNLPTQFDRESLQKYYYKRLIDSSKNVFISYVHNDTNQISRFAYELFGLNIEDITYDKSFSHILYKNQKISHFDEEIILKYNLKAFTWSATSLKTYLECKRKFYLKHILNIKEHTISVKPKSFEIGNIIHSILEEYYKDYETFNQKKFNQIFEKYKSKNPFLVLDLEIWKKKMYDFFIIEDERVKDRKIIDLEKRFQFEIDGINITGSIDRIDLFENCYEVIDYKTSSSLSIDTSKNYEKATDFQLEFYYLAINKLFKTSNIKTYYYDLNEKKLLEEIVLDEKLDLLYKKFEELKENSKNEISFSKCEDKSNCAYCIYKTICNRD